MIFDHNAIYRAYNGIVTSIDDTTGAFDKDGKKVDLDDSLVAKARTELDALAAALKYQTDRTTNGEFTYPSIGDSLDALWHCIDADDDLKVKFKVWYDAIKHVKDSNPKPS
tara:strand:- start:844 stop:1176 length:333 start_codon:yes stop_codon:yes gene_type:complete